MKALLLVLCAVFAAAVTVVDPDEGVRAPSSASTSSLEAERAELPWAQGEVGGLVLAARVGKLRSPTSVWVFEVVVEDAWNVQEKEERRASLQGIYVRWTRRASAISPRCQPVVAVTDQSGDLVGSQTPVNWWVGE